MTDTPASATLYTPTTPEVWTHSADFIQDIRGFADWTHEPKVRRFADRMTCDRNTFHLEVNDPDEAAEVYDLLLGTGATLHRTLDGPMSPRFTRTVTFGKHCVLIVRRFQ